MADGMREKTTNVGGVIKRIWYAMTGATQGAQLLSLDDAGNLEGKLLNPVINGTATGTATTTTGEASKILKLGTNGEAKAQSFQVTAMNTAPASPTATGTTGEVRVAPNGIYYCIATNTWRKALPITSTSETLTGLTTSYKTSTFSPVYTANKYMWTISGGGRYISLESLHTSYAGYAVISLVTGPTVATISSNLIYSFRLGDSEIYIKIDIDTGAVSFSVASGTITSITVNRMIINGTW